MHWYDGLKYQLCIIGVGKDINKVSTSLIIFHYKFCHNAEGHCE